MIYFNASSGSRLMFIFLTVSAQVPPLGVYLINESPQISDDSVSAEFEITRPVAGVRCFLRSRYDRIWQDCKCDSQHT